ncbi:hypothetical protein LINPERHAP1_LOCUS14626 [Linum perenne]
MKNSNSKPQSQKAARRHKKGDSKDRPLSYPDNGDESGSMSPFSIFIVLPLKRVVIFIDTACPWNDEEREESLFARVIKHALSHHTQHLSIDLQNKGNWDEKEYSFSDIFGSITDCNVKTLELGAIALDIGWKSSSFQVLTKLELSRCTILLNDEDVVDPFSRFPCLKNLVLRHIDPGEGNHNKVFRILSLQLLSLELKYIFFQRIGIYAPKLKSFTLEDPYGMLEFSELTLPSLDYADVGVRFRHCYTDDVVHYDYLTSLFNGLNNATSLMLRSSTVKELWIMSELLENQPSPFTRLKSLITEASHAPFAVIIYFLKGSSNMKPIVKFTS